MRAVYVEDNFQNAQSISVDGGKAHHLINVVRAKEGDDVLLLDGEGNYAVSKIVQVKKKNLIIEVLSNEKEEKPALEIDIAFCQVKKDALESVLKASVELGCSSLTICESTYSQRYKLNPEKMHKQMVSALEQSNNKYLPSLECKKLSEIDFTQYDEVLYFSSVQDGNADFSSTNKKYLILIGPEGGLSEEEENWLKNQEKVSFTKLDTAILRTTTAVSCAYGYLLGKIKQ